MPKYLRGRSFCSFQEALRKSKGPEAKTLEGRIIKLADKIAYINQFHLAIINSAFLFNFNFSFGTKAIQIYNNTATVIACISNIPKNSLVDIL
mgnify:CR=1 FL=1